MSEIVSPTYLAKKILKRRAKRDKTKESKIFSINFKYFWLVLLCSSCRPHTPSLPDLSAFHAAPAARAEELTMRLREQSARVSSLRLKIDAMVHKGISSQEVTQVVSFQKPDKLRLEFFATNLNRLTAIVIANGTELRGVDLVHKEAYLGRNTSENIEALLSVPFSTFDLMCWLTGVFVPDEDGMSEWYLNQEENSFLLEHTGQNGQQTRMLFRSESTEAKEMLVAESLEVRRGKDQVLFYSKFSYADFKDGYVPLRPSAIEFWLPRRELSGKLRIFESAVNEPFVSDRVWILKIPEGMDTINLDEERDGMAVNPML